MKYLQAIKDLFCPTVDSTLRQLKRTEAKLLRVSKNNRMKAQSLGVTITKLMDERVAKHAEANRAERVAERIASFTN